MRGGGNLGAARLFRRALGDRDRLLIHLDLRTVLFFRSEEMMSLSTCRLYYYYYSCRRRHQIQKQNLIVAKVDEHFCQMGVALSSKNEFDFLMWW